MAGRYLEFSDLSPLAPSLTEAAAEIHITDVEAQAVAEAPCLADPAGLTVDQVAAVQSILRQAVLRWHRAGEGGLSSVQQTAGPFSTSESFDTRSHGEGRLYAGEVRRLKALCRGAGAGPRRKAFTVAPR